MFIQVNPENLVSYECCSLFLIVAEDKTLRGAPTTVFIYLLGCVGSSLTDGFTTCVHQQTANSLGMDKSTVSRAFSLLCRKGVLEKNVDSFSKSHRYRLNLSLVHERIARVQREIDAAMKGRNVQPKRNKKLTTLRPIKGGKTDK